MGTPTATQAATSTSTTAASTSTATSTCSGEPCDSESMCRSQWGHCGSSADYCNAQSIWRAGGCTGASASTTTTPQASAGTTSSAAASTSAATSTASVSSDCIDIQGNSCSHCIATNNVCYAETKSWCDEFEYTWCGSTSVMQQSSPVLRKRARSQAFLGFIQIARSLSSRER